MNKDQIKSSIQQTVKSTFNFLMAISMVVLHWSITAVLNLLNVIWKLRRAVSPAAKKQTPAPHTCEIKKTTSIEAID